MTVKIAEGEVVVTANANAVVPAVTQTMTSSAAQAGIFAAGRKTGGSLLSGFGAVFGITAAGFAAYGVGQAIGDGIHKGVEEGIDAIQLASTLNESLNAVNVTFGEDIARDLGALAREAPQALRVTQNAFNEYAVRFADFGRKIVGPGGDVVSFMDELTTRGADFASVYNIEVSDALALFQSGLAGETEPLRRYGKDLSAASVSTYAWANGIAEVGKELTEQEKVQARYALLMEQTSDVQGDAANTAGEFANQQRGLAIRLEETQTRLGGFLLGPANDFLSMLNRDGGVLDSVDLFADRLGPKLGEALERAAPKLEALLNDQLIPLGEEWAEQAINGIPAFIDGLGEIATAAEKFNEADKWFIGIQEDFNDWVDSWNGENGLLVDLWNGFVEWGASSKFMEVGEGAGTGLMTGLEDSIAANKGTATDAAWLASDEVVTALTDPAFVSQAKSFGGGVVLGVGEGAGREKRGLEEEGARIGNLFSEGLGRGVREGRAGAVNESVASAMKMLSAAKNALGIKSPSTEGIEIGDYFMEGIGIGVQRRRAALDVTVADSMPTAQRVTATMERPSGGGPGGNTYNVDVRIDMSTIRSVEDIIAIFEALPQAARAGGRRTS